VAEPLRGFRHVGFFRALEASPAGTGGPEVDFTSIGRAPDEWVGWIDRASVLSRPTLGLDEDPRFFAFRENALVVLTTHGKHEAAAGSQLGRIVTITGDRIVTKSASNGERVHNLARDVRVTRDGKPCRIDDLKLGVSVRVTVRKDDEMTAIGIDCIPREGEDQTLSVR